MPIRNRNILMLMSSNIGLSISGEKSAVIWLGICAMVMNQPTAVAVATISITTEVVRAARALTRSRSRKESSR